MTFFKSTLLVAVTAVAAVVGGRALAQTQNATIDVKNAWVRSTVPGQMGTGAFMKITAKDGAKLVGVSSPVAGVGEVHEMKMAGDIMKMRAVESLDLPAGKTVELKPGGYHVMLMDLKQPLLKDSQVPLTLTFKDAKGIQSKLELNLPVSAVAPKP
jgi:periplasmic copper chaperone A